MDEIKVILVHSWWHDPYLIALFSSILTGFVFALVLRFHNRWMEKRDVLLSLTSELTGNYRSIKKIQDLSAVKGLENNDGMIAAFRKDMPWNIDLSDQEIILDHFKNMPVHQELSIECWNKLQSQLAKYSKDYPKYEEIYCILRRIIKFSKIKSGEINNANIAEQAAVNQLGAIRSNSMEFINYFEKNFIKNKY